MLQVYDRVLGSRSQETLVALLILVVGLYGLMWLLDFSRSRLLARYGARVQTALDGMVFEQRIMDRKTGSQTSSRDLEAVQGFFGTPTVGAIMDAPFSPLFIAVIFLFHPWLGLFSVGGGLVLIALAALSQFMTAKRVAAAQTAAEAAHRFAENAQQAGELVRSQGMMAALVARFVRVRATALQMNMRAVDWTGAFSTFSRAFRLALQSLILALGAFLVLRGEVTAGAMIAASILLGRALAPIEQIIARWPQLTQFLEARRRLHKFVIEQGEAPTRMRLPRPVGQLDVKGLTVTKDPGTPPLLYNVSFSVSPGEVLGVIGRSGSGKTTIARSILGLIEPNIGEIRLGGALVGHYGAEDTGAYVGYLPQDPMLISGTIGENIARMSLVPDSAKIVEAACKAKAHDLILSLPDGYDTRIEDNRIGLSGGQRQRIALARALFGDPVLLVLDEPNSALDQEGSEALNAAVETMKREQRAVIIMTHRPIAISVCDSLLVLDAGQVKAHGPRDEIIRAMMKNADHVQRSFASDVS